jgi:hypothetical protein
MPFSSTQIGSAVYGFCSPFPVPRSPTPNPRSAPVRLSSTLIINSYCHLREPRSNRVLFWGTLHGWLSYSGSMPSFSLGIMPLKTLQILAAVLGIDLLFTLYLSMPCFRKGDRRLEGRDACADMQLLLYIVKARGKQKGITEAPAGGLLWKG